MSAAVILAAALILTCRADAGDQANSYRGRLGKSSNKIIRQDGKTLLWADGDPDKPEKSKWYDYTGATIPAEDLQFGVGKDAIPSIDDPLFVKPTDRRLLMVGTSLYRPDEKARRVDDIRVIGYVVDGEARAYPTALLDRHELVNDELSAQAITVGWSPLALFSVVFGRTLDGQSTEFGDSGYVYKDVFVIYDRKTESLWWPLTDDGWTAISGPRKGEKIPFLEKPTVVTLGAWRKDHPNTVVLLGSKAAFASKARRHGQNRSRGRNPGKNRGKTRPRKHGG